MTGHAYMHRLPFVIPGQWARLRLWNQPPHWLRCAPLNTSLRRRWFVASIGVARAHVER